jgi:hypothetical protein
MHVKYCSACGSKINLTDPKFCPECGHSFSGTKTSAAKTPEDSEIFNEETIASLPEPQIEIRGTAAQRAVTFKDVVSQGVGLSREELSVARRRGSDAGLDKNSILSGFRKECAKVKKSQEIGVEGESIAQS